MIKQLRKVGNSTGLIIDKPLLSLLGLRAGGRVDITVEAGTLVVKPVNPARSSKA
jgi:antitoxin MazE